MRDAFFASPEFPRLLETASVKETIAKGVSGGLIAYVGKTSGGYDPFVYNQGISASEVEISDDVFIIRKDTAEEFLKSRQSSQTTSQPTTEPATHGTAPPATEPTQSSDGLFETSPLGAGDKVTRITWSGEVPPQKWSTFYNRVLAKFAVGQGLRLRVNVEVSPEDGVSKQKIDETKTALRELDWMMT